MGETTLMIGTDYGHADSSTELDALTTLKDEGGINPEMHRKIVEYNTSPSRHCHSPASSVLCRSCKSGL
jgi:hypothetical protein